MLAALAPARARCGRSATDISPLTDEQLRRGLVLLRRPMVPWAERKKLYEQFAKAAGLPGKWSLLAPFDDLSGDEM